VFFSCYLLCIHAPPLRSVLLLLLSCVLALGANIARIMVIGLLQSGSPHEANSLTYANTYLLIVPLILLLVVVDRTTHRRIKAEKLTDNTLRVAAGAGTAVGWIFSPLDWLIKGTDRLFSLLKRSERGLEKLLSRLTPKKKKKKNRR